jgi:hypothetical protein
MDKQAWAQATDAQGRTYYYNSSGAVSWTLPEAAAIPGTPSAAEPPSAEEKPAERPALVPASAPAAVPSAGLPAAAASAEQPAWMPATDAQGRTYYYSSSGAVSWALPEAAAHQPKLAQPPPPASTVVIVHTGSASRHASRNAGYLACCGCCGAGDYVEVEVDEERVSTVREERPCFSCQCCDRSQRAESVEFAHLQSIRGVEGWVPNFVFITLGIVCGILRAWGGGKAVPHCLPRLYR